ncbi:MAG: zinc-finger domain-containing protein [Thiobacillus sp.]|nr:zinc-finger domain-containing protein [Thiobacillus sp.]
MTDPKTIEVTAADLPLHCPMPGQSAWNSHPRVFLPIEDKGEVRCPYCSTVYKLTGPVKHGHH